MNEVDFINEIIQNPHDETLRIVFADYLEDEGDPRAELIRLQVQRAELGQFDPARARLRARELKLFKAHGGFGKTPTSIKATERHGGFIDGIECTITRFLNLQKEIFSNAPIRYVRLTGQSAKFDKLNESIYLGRIAGLTLKGSKATSEQLCRLVSNVGLSELRHLDIRSSDHNFNADALMRALGSANSLAKLESLRISGYFTIGASLAELPGAAFTLRQLSLSVVDDQQLGLLAESEAFADLTSLDISGNFSAEGFRTIQSGSSCRNLESLSIESTRNPYDYGARPADTQQMDRHAFDVEGGLGKLRHLQTGRYHGDAFLEPLCHRYPKLETLTLPSNNLTDRSAETLAASPLLENLKRLSLTQNMITIGGVHTLAASTQLQKKLKLYLQGNDLSPADVMEIRKQYGKTFGNLAEPWSFRRW